MFALIIAAAVHAATPADNFQAAWEVANSAAGTLDFEEMYELAASKCTRKLDREIGCEAKVAELKVTDRRQREYEAAKARPSQPVSAVEVEEDEDPVATVSSRATVPPRQVVYVDQPTGLDYVASMSPPPAPWSGIGVQLWMQDRPYITHACVMKDGMPLPLGAEVPVSLSSDRGTPVSACPAGRVSTGSVVYIPDGAQIQLLRFDIDRQVYVVEETMICRKSKPDRIQMRGSSACASH